MFSPDTLRSQLRAVERGSARTVLDDLRDRAQIAADLDVSIRTIIRWEFNEGLPVITVGKLRRYDPVEVRAWLLTRQQRRTARDAKAT